MTKKTERLLILLVLLTVAMQGVLLYRQQSGSSELQPAGGASSLTELVRDAPPGVSIDLTTLPVKGASDARVVLVEFSDYECPYCARHAARVGPDLDRTFVVSGQIRYAFANNPLPNHSNARLLATAAVCAGDQDNYWEMHDLIFARRPKAKPEIMSIVDSLKMNVTAFEHCLKENPTPAGRIERDIQKAMELGLTGTPGFALGIADGKGRVKVRKLISGAQPFEVFSGALRQLLSEGGFEE